MSYCYIEIDENTNIKLIECDYFIKNLGGSTKFENTVTYSANIFKLGLNYPDLNICITADSYDHKSKIHRILIYEENDYHRQHYLGIDYETAQEIREKIIKSDFNCSKGFKYKY